MKTRTFLPLVAALAVVENVFTGCSSIKETRAYVNGAYKIKNFK